MSDTPRTDNERVDGSYQTDMGEKITIQSWDYRKDKYGEVVPYEFAQQLERELAAVTKERDEWKQKAMEWEPRLIYMDSSEIKISAAHEVMKNLVAMFAELNKDAKNYTESLIEFKKDGREFIVTVRNKDGKTPHELRIEAERQRDLACDWIRAYIGEIEQIAKPQDIVRMKMECGL